MNVRGDLGPRFPGNDDIFPRWPPAAVGQHVDFGRFCRKTRIVLRSSRR